MPELPEVETIRRDLTRGILHKTISGVDILDGLVIRQPAKEFVRKLQGQTISAVNRRGKALDVELSSGEHLVVQLMMTGQMVLNGKQDSSTRVVFKFSDGHTVLYNDQRKFGRLRVVKNTDELKYFRIIGPEPLEKGFAPAYIAGYLKKFKRPIKTVLMDHTFVAGIGNIYASEILYHSKISPERPANRIKSSEIPLLLEQTVRVLNEAIKLRGSSMRNYVDASNKKGAFNARIQVYAREGKDCAVCKAPIRRITQAGRSTFYCMKCQR